MSGLWVVGLVLAELLPPARPHLAPRHLAVVDEKNQVEELRLAGGPTLLVPIFTRCMGTCPLVAASLNEAAAQLPDRFRVVLLSFDTADVAEDLLEFRHRLGLPSDWLVLRGVDGKATREFFDGLDFHFMKTATGFEHPNQTFVFSPKGVWAATFSGTPSSKGELESAHRWAVATDDLTASNRLLEWLSRPEAWIALAFAGFVVSLGAILLVARRQRGRFAAPTLLSPRAAHPDETRR